MIDPEVLKDAVMDIEDWAGWLEGSASLKQILVLVRSHREAKEILEDCHGISLKELVEHAANNG